MGIERISVTPAQIRLSSARDTMRILVSGHGWQSVSRDLSRDAEFRSTDESVVVIDGGIVRPVGNGTAQVAVAVGPHHEMIPVTVTGAQQSRPISFRYETLSVLTKQHCSLGKSGISFVLVRFRSSP